jgi:hypothetical protein
MLIAPQTVLHKASGTGKRAKAIRNKTEQNVLDTLAAEASAEWITASTKPPHVGGRAGATADKHQRMKEVTQAKNN